MFLNFSLIFRVIRVIYIGGGIRICATKRGGGGDAPFELTILVAKQGCMKFPTIWYSSPLPFLNFDFFLQNFSPLPLFPTRSSFLQPQYYRTDDITWTPYPFFHVIFFPKSLELPFPLHNLKFFPKGFDNPPPRGGEWGCRTLKEKWPKIKRLKKKLKHVFKPALTCQRLSKPSGLRGKLQPHFLPLER